MKISFLLLVFCLPSLRAQAFTLQDATDQAFQSSHEIKRLQLEEESADWARVKSFADFLPKIDLNGRHLFDERFEELEVPFNGSVFVMPAIQPYTSLGVGAQLNIFDGFKSVHDLSAARWAHKASSLMLERAKDRVRVETRSLFYRALGSQILVDVANHNIQTLESHLKNVTSRVNSGVSTRYDLLRVEVQLEDAKAEKVAAENAVVISRAKLFQSLGFADPGQALEGQLPEDFGTVNLTEAVRENVQRSDREALTAQKERQRSLSKAARAHWLPKVDLFGDYEWYNNFNHSITQGDERFKSSYAVGLQLKWNLFDGGASLADQKQNALAEQIAEESLEAFDQQTPVDLEESKRRFTYDIAVYNLKLSSIRKAEEAVRLAKGGVKAGTQTNTEVLDAVVDLNRAKAAAVKAQVDAIDALGALELAVGRPLL